MCSHEAVHEISNEGEGILILDGVRIEAPIILYGSQLAISFLYKEERGCVG